MWTLGGHYALFVSSLHFAFGYASNYDKVPFANLQSLQRRKYRYLASAMKTVEESGTTSHLEDEGRYRHKTTHDGPT